MLHSSFLELLYKPDFLKIVVEDKVPGALHVLRLVGGEHGHGRETSLFHIR